MSFRWPGMFVLLLAVPVLVFVYTRVAARRTRAGAALGTMAALRTRTGRPVGRRRHVPALLYLLAFVLLAVALARPETTLRLPRRVGTVVLAIDVSTSMKGTDVKPSRLAAVKRMASAFVRSEPSTIKIGVVTFGDTATVVQAATKARQQVLDAIDRMEPTGLNTAVGSGILSALEVIAGKRLPLDANALAAGSRQPQLPYLGGAVVVLFTDGNNTSGVDPVAAATVAQQAGVRIDPVGVATPDGTVVDVDGYLIATHLDEAPLKSIAGTTNGSYFSGLDASSADRITAGVDRKLTYEGKKDEVTGVVAAGAVIVLLAGAALSIRWFGRVP